jgi:hypothetical protein
MQLSRLTRSAISNQGAVMQWRLRTSPHLGEADVCGCTTACQPDAWWGGKSTSNYGSGIHW